jgi:carboxymethylenebutenolidase
MATPSIEQVARGDAGAMDMYVWQPEQPPKAAVLVIQEIFGVGEYIRAVAERLAALGFLVGAPDVFWRFAPHWQPANDAEGMQASFAQVQKLDFPLAAQDCSAALHQLAGHDGIERCGVLGFCLGGTLAWAVAAAADPDVCVSYYGSGVPSMLDLVAAVSCPTLFHFGNADQYIPGESIDALHEATAGRDDFVINVENAGHAFDNHTSEIFFNDEASRAAWTKTVAFLQTHLPA